MKNALTKNLDDPILMAMPVIPTEPLHMDDVQASTQVTDLVAQALQDRPDLAETQLELKNQKITRKSARNNLLPSLNLVAYYAGNALGGQLNPNYGAGFTPGALPPDTSTLPTSFAGVLGNAFNNSGQEYYVGGVLNIPLRNRVAKADQYRADLEYRQSQLRQQQQRKQILIEVENAQYDLEQDWAKVQAARTARDLEDKKFQIMQKEQKLGAGSTAQTLSAQHDLAIADSALTGAMTDYEKERVQLDQTIGTTLERNHISIADAIAGVASGN